MKNVIKRFFPVMAGFLSAIALSVNGSVFQSKYISDIIVREINGVGADKFVLVAGLIILYVKVWDKFITEKKWITHVLAAIFSFFMLIGLTFVANGNLSFIFPGKKQFIIACITFAGYFVLFDVALSILYGYIQKKDILGIISKIKFPAFVENHYRLCAFLFIAIMWAPYFIVHYPGSVPYDGYRQINMYYGIEPISNHHPWVLTKFIGFIMEIGRGINDNFGVFLVVLTMYLIEAFCYATVCSKIKKWGAPFGFHIFSVLFFAILPVFGAYSQVVMKDGIFSALFALYMVLYADCCIESLRKENTKKIYIHLLKLFFVGLIVCLARNNGVHMVLPADILLLVLLCRGKKRYALILTLCAMLSYYGINNILGTSIGVATGSKKEMLSIPFQQTARYLKEYPDDVSKEEEAAIRGVLNYDVLADSYMPEISDHVKDTYRNSSTPEERGRYFKAWFSMFLKHPKVYFEATFHNTYGYYYPFNNCSALGAYQFYIQGAPLAKGDFDIHYIFSEDVRYKLTDYAQTWRWIPGFAQVMNPGTYTWLLLVIAGYIIYRRRWKGLLLLVSPLLNVAVCIASPVNGYLRYAIPLIACIPILVYWGLVIGRTDKTTENVNE